MVAFGHGNMPTIETMNQTHPEATTTSIDVEEPMILSLTVEADDPEEVTTEACRIVSSVYGVDPEFVTFGTFLAVDDEQHHVSVSVGE